MVSPYRGGRHFPTGHGNKPPSSGKADFQQLLSLWQAREKEPQKGAEAELLFFTVAPDTRELQVHTFPKGRDRSSAVVEKFRRTVSTGHFGCLRRSTVAGENHTLFLGRELRAEWNAASKETPPLCIPDEIDGISFTIQEIEQEDFIALQMATEILCEDMEESMEEFIEDNFAEEEEEEYSLREGKGPSDALSLERQKEALDEQVKKDEMQEEKRKESGKLTAEHMRELRYKAKFRQERRIVKARAKARTQRSSDKGRSLDARQQEKVLQLKEALEEQFPSQSWKPSRKHK